MGDINGDRVPDVAVGGPTTNGLGQAQVFAFSGVDGRRLWVSVENDGDGDGVPDARPVVASYGRQLERIGDVDGDEILDLLSAAPFSNATGSVSILSGATGRAIGRLEPPETDPDSNPGYGYGLARLDDETGDGTPEFAI